MDWKCKKCGRFFVGEKPKKHGDFIVSYQQPAKDILCDGELIEAKFDLPETKSDKVKQVG